MTVKIRTSTLSANYQTSVELDLVSFYGLALKNSHSINSVPNLDQELKFYLTDSNGKKLEIVLPEGSYEINDLEESMNKTI